MRVWASRAWRNVWWLYHAPSSLCSSTLSQQYTNWRLNVSRNTDSGCGLMFSEEKVWSGATLTSRHSPLIARFENSQQVRRVLSKLCNYLKTNCIQCLIAWLYLSSRVVVPAGIDGAAGAAMGAVQAGRNYCGNIASCFIQARRYYCGNIASSLIQNRL